MSAARFRWIATGWSFHPVAEQAGVRAAAGRGRRALPRVRSGRRVSVCAGAQVHAVRRAEGEALGAARLSRLRAQRHRAGDLPRRRQSRAGRCAAERRTAARAASRPSSADVTDAELQRARCSRRARRALQFRQAAGRYDAARRADRDRRAHQAARLAHRHLLRGAGAAGAVRLLHLAADDRRRRSHGPAGRDASRSTARSSSCS